MTKRERFVLTLTLEQIGLEPSVANRVVGILDYRMNDYESILNSIKVIQKYFKDKKYKDSSINKILAGPRIYECNLDKIEKVESVLDKNDYSKPEIEIVETLYPHIFCHQPSPLDKKLMFYNDIKIKELIIHHPRNLMQGLKLTYARHKFLSNSLLFKEHSARTLFLDENAFVERYGINNQKLLTIYPIKEDKYLVKKI